MLSSPPKGIRLLDLLKLVAAGRAFKPCLAREALDTSIHPANTAFCQLEFEKRLADDRFC
jgi:hypothetical protein